MVDEVKVPEGTPETPQVENKEPETPQLSETEQLAIAQGWQDEKAWVESGHDPKDHRSAREFLDRGELLNKLKSTSQEVRALRENLQAMTEHNRRVYEAGVEAGIKQLKAQKKAAMKEGDLENVAELDEEIDRRSEQLNTIRQTNRAVQAPQPQQSAEFQTWVSRNQWYLNDPVMHHTANGLAIEFAKVNPNVTEQEVYKFLDKAMREEFPHKFQKKVTPPSPESGGRRGTGSGANSNSGDEFEKVLAKLPEDEAKMARRLVANKHLTKEKYVADYKAITGQGE